MSRDPKGQIMTVTLIRLEPNISKTVVDANYQQPLIRLLNSRYNKDTIVACSILLLQVPLYSITGTLKICLVLANVEVTVGVLNWAG